MKKENTVFLLVGPRGSGKSSYGKLLMDSDPQLKGISRDEILIRLFGTVYTDPYTGTAWCAYTIMERLLRKRLSSPAGTKLLLDCWTGQATERRFLINKLRTLGADKVIALYFITPVNVVSEWFWKKPGIARMDDMLENQNKGLSFYSEDAPKNDYKFFHESAESIDSDGFDDVIRVNPLQKLISFA